MNKGCKQVLEVLNNTEKLLSAQEIYNELRNNRERAPGLTTVYRALESLLKAGKISIHNPDDSERRYAAAKKEIHQHHIICKSCYVTLPISQCSLEETVTVLAQEHGFQLESHVVEFYGTCSSCTETDPHEEPVEGKEESRLDLVAI